MNLTNSTEVLMYLIRNGYTVEYKGLSLCELPKRFSGQEFDEYQVYCDKYQCKVSEIDKSLRKAVRRFLDAKQLID